MQIQGVTLENIGNGALAELFEEELRRVLENIADPNTSAEATRVINMSVTLKPKKDRKSADVGITCSAKLAGVVTFQTTFFMGTQGGKLVAVESDPRQAGLFDENKPQLVASAASVSSITDRKAGTE